MIRIYRLIFFFVLAGFNYIFVIGQTVTIETLLDTNKIELGSRAELKYIIEKKSNDVVIVPEFSDTLILGVEILQKPILDSVKLKNNKIRLEQALTITSFEEGMYYIPPQPYHVQTAYGIDTIMSKPSYLQVVGVEIDTTGTIRDIAGIERASVTFRDFLPFLLLIALALLIILIVYQVRKMKGKKNILSSPEKPSEPAHIIALRELDKLKAQKLWQQKQTKEYYSRLTGIIRTYIESKYGVLAMEKPSSEIMEEVKNAGLGRTIDLTEFEGLLNLADLIKFAKGEAQPEENFEHLENAYKLIKSTCTYNNEEKGGQLNEQKN